MALEINSIIKKANNDLSNINYLFRGTVFCNKKDRGLSVNIA